MSITPDNIKELQKLAKRQIEAWMKYRLAMQRAFAGRSIKPKDEKKFLDTETKIRQFARSLEKNLPSNLGEYNKSLTEFLQQGMKLQEYTSANQLLRDDMLYQWHGIYIGMSRSYGALKLIDKGYYPGLHRRHLVVDKSSARSAKGVMNSIGKRSSQSGSIKKKLKSQRDGDSSNEETKSGGGWKSFGTVLMAIVLIGGLIGFTLFGSDPSEKGRLEAKAKEMQQTPEGSIRFYMEAAANYRSGGTHKYSYGVQLAVTKGDWEWYEANYQTLYRDQFNVMSAMDPGTAQALMKISVLTGLLANGFNSTKFIVGDVRNNGKTAEVPVFEDTGRGGIDLDPAYARYIRLVRVKKSWKVRSFAGAIGS